MSTQSIISLENEFSVTDNVVEFPNTYKANSSDTTTTTTVPNDTTYTYAPSSNVETIYIQPITKEINQRVTVRITRNNDINDKEFQFAINEKSEVTNLINRNKELEEYLKMMMKENRDLKNEVTKQNILQLQSKINILSLQKEINSNRESVFKMKVPLMESVLRYTYYILITFFLSVTLISSISFLGLDFIPSPIDKVLLISSLVATIGLYLDYITKDKKRING